MKKTNLYKRVKNLQAKPLLNSGSESLMVLDQICQRWNHVSLASDVIKRLLEHGQHLGSAWENDETLKLDYYFLTEL
jgi:hypothetical protein